MKTPWHGVLAKYQVVTMVVLMYPILNSLMNQTLPAALSGSVTFRPDLVVPDSSFSPLLRVKQSSETARLLLSHLGMLGIESIKVRFGHVGQVRPCWSGSAMLVGRFCTTRGHGL